MQDNSLNVRETRIERFFILDFSFWVRSAFLPYLSRVEHDTHTLSRDTRGDSIAPQYSHRRVILVWDRDISPSRSGESEEISDDIRGGAYENEWYPDDSEKWEIIKNENPDFSIWRKSSSLYTRKAKILVFLFSFSVPADIYICPILSGFTTASALFGKLLLEGMR